MGTKILLLIFLLFTQQAYAGVNLKIGDTINTSKNSTREFSYLLSYEYKHNSNAIEIETGYTSTQIKNEKWIGQWCEGNKVWGDYSKRGRLNIFPIALSYKRYFHNDKLFIGIGAGWQFFDFREYYDGKATVHSQMLQQLYGGYNINKNWLLEIKRIWSDLDIESGVENIGTAENYSRLNRVVVNLVYKF